MRDRLDRLLSAHYIGRKAGLMLCLQAVWGLYGYSLMLLNDVPRSARATFSYADRIMPLWWWGVAWQLLAATLLVGAFTRYKAGVLTLSAVFVAVWAVLQAASWVVNDAPRGWVGGVLFLAFAAFHTVLSGYPETRPHPPKVRR